MAGASSTYNNQPIDVVVAWVDGGDPTLAMKRSRYIAGQDMNPDSSVHPTRFASVNEIRYCILSILRFAPFIRNIYIVTDGQDPNINQTISAHFPERLDSIRIVDHKEIFEGFEQYLPTFNSISIGNMIWRIKGLSNNFVYFNDDTFLIREIKPEDWFINCKPMIRGKWMLIPVLRILWRGLRILVNRYMLFNSGYEPGVSFHLGQWNSAWMLGQRWRYFVHRHTPHAADRTIAEEYFSRNTEVLKKNISYRFRNYCQFTFISLSNHLQLKGGNTNIAKPDLAYLQPYKRSKGYIGKKIDYCERNGNVKFMCVQSLDMCPKDQQDKLFDWLESRMGLQLKANAPSK